ncbi:MAG: hypothetical protein HQL63_02425 [Magnetococcales bacterium]|nr:hypothetical protein [Magnetococcales bacterium]MBF0321390.1 hypothetical protein [Magnetococcales bacterium]
MVGEFRAKKRNKSRGNNVPDQAHAYHNPNDGANNTQAGTARLGDETLHNWDEALDHLRQEYVDLMHKYNSHIGRLRKQNDQLLAQSQNLHPTNLSAQPSGNHRYPWADAWKQMQKQGHYRDLLGPLESRLHYLEEWLQAVTQFAKSQHECNKLEREHPDYGDIANDQDFHAWLERQPSPIREVVERNAHWINNSGDVIWLLKEYKAFRDEGKTAQDQKDKQLQERRALQVQSGAAVPSRGPGTGENLPDTFGKQVAYFRQQLRTKGRAK